MKKRFLIAALSFVMIFALAACSGNKSETPAAAPAGGSSTTPAAPAGDADQSDWPEYDVAFASYLPEANPTHVVIVVLQRHLDELMPGKINIQLYASGSLLAQNDIYDGILQGTAEMGWVDFGTVADRFPLSQLLVYPGLTFNSSEAASRTFYDWVQETQPAEFNDVYPYLLIGSGPLGLLSDRPVHNVADVKGMQIRASAVSGRTVESWGATPVTIPISEVYEGLRSGLLDGQYNYMVDFAKNRFYEVADYAMVCSLNNTITGAVINKDFIAGMPPEMQALFYQACEEAFDEICNFQDVGHNYDGVEYTGWDSSDPDLIAEFEKLKIYFLDPGTPDYQSFVDASAPLQAAYVKSLDDKGLDGTGNLSKLQEIASKYNAAWTWEDEKALMLSTVPTTNVENP
jgi:TRAP-type C4-dicarboxylate transport system substrate-binding protein